LLEELHKDQQEMKRDMDQRFDYLEPKVIDLKGHMRGLKESVKSLEENEPKQV